MTVVGVGEAKTHLSRLLRELADGHDVVIERGGVPEARLVHIGPIGPEFGCDRDAVWIAEDFDDPLPTDIQQHVE